MSKFPVNSGCRGYAAIFNMPEQVVILAPDLATLEKFSRQLTNEFDPAKARLVKLVAVDAALPVEPKQKVISDISAQ